MMITMMMMMMMMMIIIITIIIIVVIIIMLLIVMVVVGWWWLIRPSRGPDGKAEDGTASSDLRSGGGSLPRGWMWREPLWNFTEICQSWGSLSLIYLISTCCLFAL